MAVDQTLRGTCRGEQLTRAYSSQMWQMSGEHLHWVPIVNGAEYPNVRELKFIANLYEH